MESNSQQSQGLDSFSDSMAGTVVGAGSLCCWPRARRRASRSCRRLCAGARQAGLGRLRTKPAAGSAMLSTSSRAKAPRATMSRSQSPVVLTKSSASPCPSNPITASRAAKRSVGKAV